MIVFISNSNTNKINNDRHSTYPKEYLKTAYVSMNKNVCLLLFRKQKYLSFRLCPFKSVSIVQFFLWQFYDKFYVKIYPKSFFSVFWGNFGNCGAPPFGAEYRAPEGGPLQRTSLATRSSAPGQSGRGAGLVARVSGGCRAARRIDLGLIAVNIT